MDPMVWERSAARAPTRYMTASRVVALREHKKEKEKEQVKSEWVGDNAHPLAVATLLQDGTNPYSLYCPPLFLSALGRNFASYGET